MNYYCYCVNMNRQKRVWFLPVSSSVSCASHKQCQTRLLRDFNPFTLIDILDYYSVTLRGPPLDSETGLTGELWSNRVHLILKN